MINFIINYFNTYPDLAILLAVLIVSIPLFLLLRRDKIIALIFSAYFSFVLVKAFPKKELLNQINVHKFLSGEVLSFILLVLIVFFFLILSGFVSGGRKKSILKNFLLSFIFIFLIFSFYFGFLSDTYQNFSPLVKLVFLQDYSSLVFRAIPILLAPFLI